MNIWGDDKLALNWDGPYSVIQVFNRGAYLLTDIVAFNNHLWSTWSTVARGHHITIYTYKKNIYIYIYNTSPNSLY